MDSGGIWVFFLTDKTSYHKHLKWDKKWDNPNREVRYDVDKMESGLEKPYLLQRIAGKRFVEVVEVRGLKFLSFPSTKWKLLFCNNIELDTVSNNLPELSVYKVRPFQVSKWDQFTITPEKHQLFIPDYNST